MKPRRDVDGLDFHRWYAQRQRAQQERAFSMVANYFAIVFADLSSNYSTCTLVTLSGKTRLVTLLEDEHADIMPHQCCARLSGLP